MALEALFVPLPVPIGEAIAAPLWAARTHLKRAPEAEEWVIDCLENGRPLFGRVFPRMRRSQAIVFLRTLGWGATLSGRAVVLSGSTTV